MKSEENVVRDIQCAPFKVCLVMAAIYQAARNQRTFCRISPRHLTGPRRKVWELLRILAFRRIAPCIFFAASPPWQVKCSDAKSRGSPRA